MQSISPRQDRFCFCGKAAASEPHHVLHKSLGGVGLNHNLVDICPEHHAAMHPEKLGGRGIKVTENSSDVLRIIDNETGEVIYEAWKPPEWWPQKRTEMLAALESSDRTILMAARSYFKYLDPIETEEVYDLLKELDRSLWEAGARLLLYARLRMPYGTRTEQFNALVQQLGIQKSTAYKQIAALMEVDKNPEVFQNLEKSGKLPSADVILLAAKNDDPVAAIELYVDREAQNPRYSLAQFREDLHRKNDSMQPEPEYCRGHCADCGRLLAPHVRSTP